MCRGTRGRARVRGPRGWTVHTRSRSGQRCGPRTYVRYPQAAAHPNTEPRPRTVRCGRTAPFGLPVLAEVPELAQVLERRSSGRGGSCSPPSMGRGAGPTGNTTPSTSRCWRRRPARARRTGRPATGSARSPMTTVAGMWVCSWVSGVPRAGRHLPQRRRRLGTGAGGGMSTTLLLRADLDTLFGHDGLPAQLLHGLAGGRVHVDAATARRLADAGTDTRLVILDHGDVVGVGTKRRQPPGWLRDAILAVHDTVLRGPTNVPGSARRPVRGPGAPAPTAAGHRWNDACTGCCAAIHQHPVPGHPAVAHPTAATHRAATIRPSRARTRPRAPPTCRSEPPHQPPAAARDPRT
jgi:hypothetical protein